MFNSKFAVLLLMLLFSFSDNMKPGGRSPFIQALLVSRAALVGKGWCGLVMWLIKIGVLDKRFGAG